MFSVLIEAYRSAQSSLTGSVKYVAHRRGDSGAGEGVMGAS